MRRIDEFPAAALGAAECSASAQLRCCECAGKFLQVGSAGLLNDILRRRGVPRQPASVVECRVEVRQNGSLELSRTHRHIA
jgi:hypothetical protein